MGINLAQLNIDWRLVATDIRDYFRDYYLFDVSGASDYELINSINDQRICQ